MLLSLLAALQNSYAASAAIAAVSTSFVDFFNLDRVDMHALDMLLTAGCLAEQLSCCGCRCCCSHLLFTLDIVVRHALDMLLTAGCLAKELGCFSCHCRCFHLLCFFEPLTG
jgi:hypothetical protein